MKRQLLAAALFALTATPAAAYTSYLKPDSYWPEDRDVRVEGSYASEFFTPQIALPASFTALNPGGSQVSLDQIAVAASETIVTASLPAGGTYRISTGEQLGQVTTVAYIDGQWRSLRAGEAPPEGAPTSTLQAVTVADVYVTRGQATRDVVDRPIGRLAVRPITHPNQILAANGFEIELLFDGAPLANSAIVLYADGDPDTNLQTYIVTDANGRATFTFPASGEYVIAARHRADAPTGSAAAVHSYTTTVTIQALDALPVGYDANARDAEAARENERDARRTERPRRRVGRPDN
jgi:hypothetical protein